MRNPKVFPRIPLSRLACLALFGCRSKGGASPEAVGGPTASAPGGLDATAVAEATPPAIAGAWVDEIGDARGARSC